MRSLIFVSDFNKSNITGDYIVFFFAIRVKKFLYNMQLIMLSGSIPALFANRNSRLSFKLWKNDF
jgi:hypothetical protein